MFTEWNLIFPPDGCWDKKSTNVGLVGTQVRKYVCVGREGGDLNLQKTGVNGCKRQQGMLGQITGHISHSMALHCANPAGKAFVDFHPKCPALLLQTFSISHAFRRGAVIPLLSSYLCFSNSHPSLKPQIELIQILPFCTEVPLR